jgi:hypothetical protein
MRLVKKSTPPVQQVIASIYSSVLAMSRIGVTSYTHELPHGTTKHAHAILAGIRTLFPTCSVRHSTVTGGLDCINVDILVVDWS